MRPSKYTREVLEPVASESRSMAEVLKKLGIRPTGGNYRMIAFRLRFHGITTGHFKGQGWADGLSQETDPGIAQHTLRRRRPDDEVFVANSPETCGQRLVRRLLRLGWEYKCAECGIGEWNR
jgi:hypothetical protein